MASESRLEGLVPNCTSSRFAEKRQGTAALQDASAFSGTLLYRKVLECGCPLPLSRVLTMAGVGGQCFEDLKSKAVIALVAACALVGGALIVLKHRAGPPVTVTLRIAVAPAEQLGFVTGRGNSAQFKYLMGKQSGVKPVAGPEALAHSRCRTPRSWRRGSAC